MDGVVNTNTPKTFNDRCWNPSVRNRDFIQEELLLR